MKRHKVDTVNKSSGDISESIFESIHALMHLIRSEQYRVLRDSPYQLRHMEGKMLAFCYHHPGSTLRDLVERTGRDKGQLARTIKQLKAQGLLNADPSPNDRRIQLLSLTDAGRQVHESLMEQLQVLTQKAVRGMPKAECERLLTMLNQVRQNIVRE